MNRLLKAFFTTNSVNYSVQSLIKNDKILLNKLKMLTDRLGGTNSVNEKVEIITDAGELRGLLEIIYSPTAKFHITSTRLKKTQNTDEADGIKLREEYEPSIVSLTDLLDKLKKREISGNAAIRAVKELIRLHPEYEEMILMIIDKNLKVRIGYDILKRAYSEDSIVALNNETMNIPCQLGYSVEMHEKYLRKSLESGEKWYISRKYDGIRAFIKYDHNSGGVEVMSRNMSPISNINPALMEALRDSFRGLERSVVLDGELVYLGGGKDEDDFSKTVSLVKSLEPKSIDGLEYRVFDILNLKSSDSLFTQRQEHLRDLLRDCNNRSIIKMVEQDVLEGEYNFGELICKASELKYEGFIMRRDVSVQNGRSRDLLKIKPFLDDEFKVVDYQIGPMRLINDSKMEEEEEVLLSIVVEHGGGERVNVGSGFSNAERRAFGKDPNLILGKIVTIRYQSESRAKGRDSKSLRFPIFKTLHGNQRSE